MKRVAVLLACMVISVFFLIRSHWAYASAETQLEIFRGLESQNYQFLALDDAGTSPQAMLLGAAYTERIQNQREMEEQRLCREWKR